MNDNIYINLAKHCIGLDHKKPYKRHGRYFYRPYRNYYDAGGKDVEVWDILVDTGYAESGEENSHGGRMYWLTREGLDWLGEKLGIQIWDEEELNMKYKVGDEVFVRCKIINVYPGSTVPYQVIGANCNPGFAKPLYIAVRDDDIYDMTAEEAWEIAKNLFADYSDIEIDEIFGKEWSFSKLMELTPQQAKAKIEAWKAKKEINIGDEVEITYSGNKFFVSHINSENQGFPYNGFDKNFGIYHDWARNQLEKTGRHIDIEGMLKQIGEYE